MTEVRDHGRWCGRIGKFLWGLGVHIAACGAVVVSAEANREVVAALASSRFVPLLSVHPGGCAWPGQEGQLGLEARRRGPVPRKRCGLLCVSCAPLTSR